MKPACYFHTLGYPACEDRPDGQRDPAHMIPAARLRAAGLTHDQVWDRRNLVPSCRAHHHRFDQKQIRLYADQYPDSVHEFALEHGFWFAGPADGWLHAAPADPDADIARPGAW